MNYQISAEAIKSISGKQYMYVIIAMHDYDLIYIINQQICIL